MKFKQAHYSKINGSSLRGHLDVSYDTLVAVFGEPHSDGDAYKVQAEWELEFEDGTVATIYDYKQGDAYNGPGQGTPPERVTDWHVGGFNADAFRYVKDALQNYRPTKAELAEPTEGPWEGSTTLNILIRNLADEISSEIGYGNMPEVEANYHLIRSAPLLMDVLASAIVAFEDSLDAGNKKLVYAKMKKVMAQARGRS